MRPSPLRLTLLFPIALLACGGPQEGPAGATAELRTLPEGRALGVVREALREAGADSGGPFAVEVGAEPLEVDVALADVPRFGIEWVSASDRLGREDLPEPLDDGQLRILPGTGGDASVQILLLDEQTYRFHPNSEAVQAGALGISEAELRLRRDVTDFVTYARGIGG